MNSFKRETRVVASGKDDHEMLDMAGNESELSASQTKPIRVTFARRLASYFMGEYAFLTANGDITLEQLYRKLLLAEAKDTRARAKFHEMMYAMASDLRAQKESPLAGLPVSLARPMSAWRERYNELDRYLGR